MLTDAEKKLWQQTLEQLNRHNLYCAFGNAATNGWIPRWQFPVPGVVHPRCKFFPVGNFPMIRAEEPSLPVLKLKIHS